MANYPPVSGVLVGIQELEDMIRAISIYASMDAIVCRASLCNYPTVTTANRLCVPDLSRLTFRGDTNDW